MGWLGDRTTGFARAERLVGIRPVDMIVYGPLDLADGAVESWLSKNLREEVSFAFGERAGKRSGVRH